MTWNSTGMINFTLTDANLTATRSDSTAWNGRVSTTSAGSSWTFRLDRSSGGDNFVVCLVNAAQTTSPSPPYGDTSQNLQFGVLIEGTLGGTGNLYYSLGSSWITAGTVNMTDTTDYKFYKDGSTWNFSVDGVDKITGVIDSGNYYLQCRNQNADLSCTVEAAASSGGTRLPPPPIVVHF